MFCTKCGNQMNENDVFCGRCGNKNMNQANSSAGKKTCIRCGTNMGETIQTCPSCGLGQNGVPNNGARVNHNPHQYAQNAYQTVNQQVAVKKKTPLMPIIIIAGALVLVAVAVVLIIVLTSKPSYVGTWEVKEYRIANIEEVDPEDLALMQEENLQLKNGIIKMQLTFSESGLSNSYAYREGEVYEESGTWMDMGDYIIVTIDGYPENLHRDGSYLILASENLYYGTMVEVVFEKVG